MNISAAPLVFVMVLTLLFSGSVLFLLGRRLPRSGDWWLAFSLLAALGFSFWATHLLRERDAKPEDWFVSWVLPLSEKGSLALNLVHDTLSSVSIIGFLLFSLVILLCDRATGGVKNPAVSYGALAWGVAGAALAAVSQTPWLMFFGVGILVVAGFVSLISDPVGPDASLVTASFGRENSMSAALLCFGAIALGAKQPPQFWFERGLLEGASSVSLSAKAGLIAFSIGAISFFRPYPFHRWGMISATHLSLSQWLLTRLFPSWLGMGVLLRNEALLRKVGLFPILLSVGAVSGFFSILVGITRSDWREGLSLHLSGVFCFGLLALGVNGSQSALMLIMGASAGILAILIVNEKSPQGEQSTSKVEARKWILWVTAATLGGLPGFLYTSSMVRVFSSGLTSLSGAVAGVGLSGVFELAAILVSFAALSFLGWRAVFLSLRGDAVTLDTRSVSGVGLLLVFALAFAWTGSFTGGWLPATTDFWSRSLLEGVSSDLLMSPRSDALGLLPEMLVLSLGGLVFLVSWWTLRGEDRLKKVWAAFPRAVSWVVNGFWLNRAFDGLFVAFSAIARTSQIWFEEGLWKGPPARRVEKIARGLANGLASADSDLVELPIRGARKVTDLPAKLFQLLQSGDLQWYLFVALGLGFSLMAHFLPKGK
jgi:hypothetical protein